ncbi:hypothetical protein LTR78_004733 [Recurvomyces mirabilis]|uniref:Uncharacterized protein n=1 Tax=Recurvomyces mirabilis TaxID=574656 RepID=A0AAE0WP04_9PEZI|nr:hypothetical protein LTR78_004733 [Recurvomyces mirabilis]KAK5157905.1 hypothetical protein LTS14_003827 [Recurvomyces mirabilis]
MGRSKAGSQLSNGSYASRRGRSPPRSECYKYTNAEPESYDSYIEHDNTLVRYQERRAAAPYDPYELVGAYSGLSLTSRSSTGSRRRSQVQAIYSDYTRSPPAYDSRYIQTTPRRSSTTSSHSSYDRGDGSRSTSGRSSAAASSGYGYSDASTNRYLASDRGSELRPSDSASNISSYRGSNRSSRTSASVRNDLERVDEYIAQELGYGDHDGAAYDRKMNSYVNVVRPF